MSEAVRPIDKMPLAELIALGDWRNVNPDMIVGVDLRGDYGTLPPLAKSFHAISGALCGQTLDSWGRYGMHPNSCLPEFSSFESFTAGQSPEDVIRTVLILKKFFNDLEQRAQHFARDIIYSGESLTHARAWVAQMLRELDDQTKLACLKAGMVEFGEDLRSNLIKGLDQELSIRELVDGGKIDAGNLYGTRQGVSFLQTPYYGINQLIANSRLLISTIDLGQVGSQLFINTSNEQSVYGLNLDELQHLIEHGEPMQLRAKIVRQISRIPKFRFFKLWTEQKNAYDFALFSDDRPAPPTQRGMKVQTVQDDIVGTRNEILPVIKDFLERVNRNS